jgi:pimeloyl-ACP methyl ester carboxylesterase
MPFAHRGGCRLYYELHGDGPALVLVRGLGRSSRAWAPLVAELAGLRLLLLDNRGVGRSDATRPPYTTRQLADDVAAVMDDARLERAHTFGMSLGGMIVQQLALAHPSRVDRLVIGCSTPGGRTASRGSLRALWQMRGQRDPGPVRGVLGQLLAVTRHDIYDRLGDIHHATLVITGDADRVIPPRNSRLLAERIPNARLVELPGAPHDFVTAQPAATARELSTFLGEKRR